MTTEPSSTAGVRRKSRAGYFVAIQQAATLAIHFVQVYVMSRLIVPEEYGLVAMAGSIFSMAAMFKDFGFSTSTIQAENVTHQNSTNLFWVGWGFSFLVVAVILVCSPLFAGWFKEPLVASLLFAFSLTFLIESAGNQPTALAQRKFLFAPLAIWRMVGIVIGLSTGIGLALLGWGPWAVISINCVEALVVTIGAFWVSGFWPGWIKDIRQTKQHLKFGTVLTIGGLLSFAATNVDRFLIGRFLGAENLGYYTRAQNLLLLPMSKVLTGFKRFNIASLARLTDDPAAFRYHLSQLLAWYLFVCTIIVVPLAACAEDLIHIIMGDRWLPVAPLFAILAPYIWVHVTSLICYLAHVSKGDARGLTSYYAINFLVLSSALAITVLVSKNLSVVVLVSMLTGILITQSTLIYFAWKKEFLDLRSFLKVYLLNAMVAALAFGLLKSLQSWLFVAAHPAIRLVAGCAIGVTLMALMYMVVPEFRVVLKEVYRTFRKGLNLAFWFVPRSTVSSGNER